VRLCSSCDRGASLILLSNVPMPAGRSCKDPGRFTRTTGFVVLMIVIAVACVGAIGMFPSCHQIMLMPASRVLATAPHVYGSLN
jgi:hypothetical protein